MVEAKASGRGVTRGRGWFSSGEKKLFFDLQKAAIRKSMVCPVVFTPAKSPCTYLFLTWTVLKLCAARELRACPQAVFCWNPKGRVHT